MSANVLPFPPRDEHLSISKKRLRTLAIARKNLNSSWKKLFLAEQKLRKREQELTQLEAQIEIEENLVREALAAGAEIEE